MGAGVFVDARQSRRILVRLPVSLIVDTTSGWESHPGSALDLSDRGLRVSTAAALASEQIVGVILNKTPERCRVAWTGLPGTPKSGQAGLQFLNPLPD
ncbi:MAG: PilZ domain-containing protein [Terriglobales bacterium]